MLRVRVFLPYRETLRYKCASFKGKNDAAHKTWKCPTCYSLRLRGGWTSGSKELLQPSTPQKELELYFDAQSSSWEESKFDRIVIRLERPMERPNKLNTMALSMHELNTKVESESILGKCDEIFRQNKSLWESNEHFQKENKELTSRISKLEQYSRANNIEIKGIPVTLNENCELIVRTIG